MWPLRAETEMNTKNSLFFEWSDAMSVGIPEIDKQHRELVSLLNRLFVSVVQRDKEVVAVQILDALIDYSKTHFVLEERLMQETGYDADEYALHQRTHQEFIDKVGAVAQKNLVEGKSISFEMIQFLKHWLRDHILVADMRYAEAAKAAGVVVANWSVSASETVRIRQKAQPRPWWKVW